MRAIFLDRDGVLNENRADYVKSWQEFRWLPGAIEALAVLATQEAPIIVVTNQSMIGRGLVAPAGLDDIHRRMRREVAEYGGRIDAVYACPHTPADACPCRKPLPGLLLRAAAEHQVTLAESVLVGDAFTDFQAAAAVAMPYIHVRSGLGPDEAARVRAASGQVPIVASLRAAIPLCAPAPARLTAPVA
jgi:D-glycero-D-manno-heptose 1,7-bisphosphate phosphatase